MGDFFCCGWQEYHQVSTLAVCVNPGSAFNCYWTMPFRQQCRITLENRGEEEAVYYYQIDYTLGEVPQDAAYFHAQFRRVNPPALQRGVHHPGRGAGPGPLRGHVHGLGRAQQRLVGGKGR